MHQHDPDNETGGPAADLAARIPAPVALDALHGPAHRGVVLLPYDTATRLAVGTLHLEHHRLAIPHEDASDRSARAQQQIARCRALGRPGVLSDLEGPN